MNFNEKIDDFIFGKLPATENVTFQNQLFIDTELASEVDKRKQILFGLEALGNQKLKLQIQNVRKEMLDENSRKSNGKNSNKYFRLLLSVAAVVILLIAASQIFFNKEISSSELYTENFESYSTNFTTRDNSTIDNLTKAYNLYTSKDFEAVIPLLETIIQEQPYNSDVQLALGSSYMSTNEIDKAMKHFLSILQRNDSLYSDQAKWYLALCHLKQDDIKSCNLYLEMLSSDKTADFHKDAKALLEKLK